MLALFPLIYTTSTVQLAILMRLQVKNIAAIGVDLKNISENGVALSHTAQTFLEHSPVVNESLVGPISRSLMFGAMFLVTILYPVYCKRRTID